MVRHKVAKPPSQNCIGKYDMLRFWLKWSLRDFRQRWLQIVAIAMIVALGAGAYAGLGSQQEWREDSYDASFEGLNMYDLKLHLAENTFHEQEQLVEELGSIDGIAALEPRLVLPTLVEVGSSDDTLMVQGRIVGMPPEPSVNQLYVRDGRNLSESDNGQPIAVVDYLFARHHGFDPGTSLSISGGHSLEFVGTAQAPEYFMIIPDDSGIVLGESGFAVLFMPLESLQTITGRAGLINDVVILLDEGADVAAIEAEIEARLDVGYTLNTQEEDQVRTVMYSDAAGDQEIMYTIAFLFLFGAAMAAFNLAGRIVQSQRRQIGIGMALGVKQYWLAIRPMLLGVQIAILGTVFGLIFGLVLSFAFADFFRTDFLPLPDWQDPFYIESFAVAIILGAVIPFLATLYPVWQAVRVSPIEAIQPSAQNRTGLAPLLKRIPGRSFVQMPARNLLRAPWRTLFTALGIGIAIVLLTVMVGFIDTFSATIDRFDEANLQSSPDRLSVVLDQLYPVDAEVVANADQLATQSETNLILEGRLADEIDVTLELRPTDSTIWVPELVEGRFDGLVISQKAADDLDVAVGDSITLEHPVLEENFRTTETEFEIRGIHNNPLRTPVYLPLDEAAMMGLTNITNYVVLKSDLSENDVRATLFQEPGVASVQAAGDVSEAFEEALGFLSQILRVTQVIVIALAFLIAFNSTSINVDERVREIATMFAFGLRVRTATRMQIMENTIMGILGTIIGLLAGFALLNVIFAQQLSEMFPDIRFTVAISVGTVILAAFMGVLVVALTPLLSIRRMESMDIPSTLRVVE